MTALSRTYPPTHAGPQTTGGLNLGMAPVDYWPLRETNGTAIEDLGTQGNNGTLQAGTLGGQPGPISRVLGGSRYYETNGNTQWILLPSDDYGLQGQAKASITAWVKRATGQPDAFGTVITLNRPATTSSRLFVAVLSGGEFYANAQSNAEGAQAAQTVATLSATAWSHIAAVFDLSGDNISLYINGALSKSQGVSFSQGTFAATSGYGSICAYNSGFGAYTGGLDYKGQLAHLGVWDTGLTLAQIDTLYLTGKNGG